MKYRLYETYRLEGWRGLPTGLYDSDSGETVFLPSEQYRLLLHMDGMEDIHEENLSEREREIINHLISRKIIRSCAEDDPISPLQKYHYIDRTYIAYVHWAITGKCNYRCKHCYMYAPQAKFPEASKDECRRIIQSLQDAGVRHIALTGGEPLVRSDFLELIDEIIAHDIQVHSIYTNGALVDEYLLTELERRGQKPRFHISYDGWTYHDWLRGVPGARDAALQAISLCKAHGNDVYAAMCVHRKNQHEIFETLRYLSTCGVSRLRVKFMLPNGMWADEHASESMSMEEAVETLVEFLEAFFASGMPASVVVDNMFQYDREQKFCTIPYARNCRQDGYLCKKTVVTPYIGPTGRVLPCMTLGGCDFQALFPNVLETPLADIMSDSNYRKMTRTRKNEFFDMHEECRECSERDVCTTGCRACATDEYLGLDKWNCAFLKGGYYRRIDQTIRDALDKHHLNSEVFYSCFIK